MDNRAHITQIMTAYLLEAIASSRPAAASVTFQGGGALKYVYGSPRASVDLDFVAVEDAEVEKIVRTAAGSLAAAAPRHGLFIGSQIKVKAPGRPGRNPRVYEIVCEQRRGIPNIVVKTEFFMAPRTEFNRYQRTAIQPVRVVSVPQLAPIIPTATRQVLLHDKVHALAARRFLKARDLFDIHWLSAAFPEEAKLSRALLEDQARLYGEPPESIRSWPQAIVDRLAAADVSRIRTELAQFLPAAPTVADVELMLKTAARYGQELAAIVGAPAVRTKKPPSHAP